MPSRRAFALLGAFLSLLALLSVICVTSAAQTTQGLIAGTLSDVTSGEPIAAAEITIYQQNGDISRTTVSTESGFFVIPLLSPGTYRLRAKAARFQTLEWNNLELGVAARLTISIALRQINDVWEKNQVKSVFLPGGSVLQIFGPDVDPTRTADFDPQKARRGTLESTVSEVIQGGELRDLPLENRDAYALLVTLPGVTTDLPVTRGLGLSVNGQRPTSSTYLVDGFDNNNHLITGPLATLAPDAIAEYRISTNNFSSEYGGASGYIANVASRAGGAAWHGLAYYYFGNRDLDANDFQRNRQQLARPPDQSNRPGFFAAGPLRKPTLFISGAFEYFYFQSTSETAQFTLPGAQSQVPPGSFAA
ncbi:MAG: carboxypeptidase-like regulatory domain-containing protein, partial [Acidobacteriota bacterium]